MNEPASITPTGGHPDAAVDGSASAGGAAASAGGPRRVRLALTRINPFSVMKVSLLLSVAGGIMFVVAACFVWLMLDLMHVFATIRDLAATVVDQKSNSFVALVEYLKLKNTFSMSIIIAVLNAVLTTALSTIGAVLYNLTATLVGGVHLTLADE